MSKIVVADYDYEGQDTTQLTFKEGDRIIVLEEDDTGWWMGKLEKDGTEGYFPSTFVKPLPGTDEPQPHQSQDNDPPNPPSQVRKAEEMNKLQSVSVDESNANEAKQKEEDAVIDYNNYFANAQKIVSVPDNFDGDEAAASENYYSAEVLNLKFNPNAKTRYGLASHYMSLFASIMTITLSTSCFAWSNGSDWLKERDLVNTKTDANVCLIIGLYGFFGGIILLIWEYILGDIRPASRIPWRCLLYFCFGFPLFFTLPSSLCGVLWFDCSIMSFLAFKNGESYERKSKKSYSSDPVLSPRERIRWSNIKNNLQLKWVDIRQQSQLGAYLFVAVYLLFNLIYILYWAVFYSGMVEEMNDAARLTEAYGPYTGNDLALLMGRNGGSVLTGWFPVAKMFGNLLDINCAFILLPVCRSFISQLYNISTDQRSFSRQCSRLLQYMPLDCALQFHKLCGVLIMIGTVLHTWAHFNHFASVPSTYEVVYGATVWISGSLIIICMHFMYGTSFASVRHGKYELFWYAHHLFVVFFISCLLHGAGSWNPNFWKWFIAPGILYGVERSIRELRARQAVGVVSVLHMNSSSARVFCLELSKQKNMCSSHQEGQYVFIKAPAISALQWHPFTISSPPDPARQTLTIHIRNMGDGSWTDRLQQFFVAAAPGRAYCKLHHFDGATQQLVPQTIGPDGNNLICIDGPMAAPTQHLGEYSTSIIIGAGIGLTPLRATLQSIIYNKFKRGIGHTFPDHAYCVWIVNYKQLNAYRFMCRTLKDVEDQMYDQIKKNSLQKLLQCHIFVTSAPDSAPDDPVAIDETDDLAAWGNHYYGNDADNTTRHTAPFDEADIWKLLNKPTQQPTQIGHIIVHKGRPKWDQFFEPIQCKHEGNRIGVMFCGPNIIAKDLKKACGQFTDFTTNTVFLLHKENF